MPIDLDHNATTRPLPEVIETVARISAEAYANPGSRHAAGRKARRVLEEARETVAEILHARPQEVVFTSGGTESTNLALLGFAAGRKGTVLLPSAEHPATEETVKDLIFKGWKRHTLPLDAEGRIPITAYDDVPWSEVKLATLLLAHNETGVLQDVAPLASRCAEHSIPLHVDAVQAVGKIDVDFDALGATTLALGAHKFHGPRGIGALLIREGTRLPATQFGGHQESGHRPGTECVALAAGMATALRLWHEDREQRTAHIRTLRDRLQAGLSEQCAPVVINGSQEHRLPNTLNIAFPGIDGDALLVALDLEGICVSLGSACASGSSEPAPVLMAMNIPREIALASVRLTLGIDNTQAELDIAIDRITTTVTRLRTK
ncbi:MAG: cysteine desulfurase [Planctomycetaceae bacterium]|nr:cysteine desulfurase [Planctomycetaceae bacterium]